MFFTFGIKCDFWRLIHFCLLFHFAILNQLVPLYSIYSTALPTAYFYLKKYIKITKKKFVLRYFYTISKRYRKTSLFKESVLILMIARLVWQIFRWFYFFWDQHFPYKIVVAHLSYSKIIYYASFTMSDIKELKLINLLSMVKMDKLWANLWKKNLRAQVGVEPTPLVCWIRALPTKLPSH